MKGPLEGKVNALKIISNIFVPCLKLHPNWKVINLVIRIMLKKKLCHLNSEKNSVERLNFAMTYNVYAVERKR